MRIGWSLFFCAAILGSAQILADSPYRPAIPKTWDEAALAEWATPLAGLNARPAHISPREYYSMPVDNLRSYPVYLPGREPEGYWKMLQAIGPQPLVEPERLKNQADWIEAGRRIFEEGDHIHLRTLDPQFIEAARKGDSALPGPNGTARNMRWVPTERGVALSFPNCANCHVQTRPDGTRIMGAPAFALAIPAIPPGGRRRLISRVQFALHLVDGGSPIRMGQEPFGMWLYRAFSVPWKANDENAQLKDLTEAGFADLLAAGLRGGALPRWNGSPYYPAKIPDLIGIGERKYIDATGTHLNRGVGDLMRYSALVSFAETTTFGTHNVLAADSERPRKRRSDEALFALALYLQSLKAPGNPYRASDKSNAGEAIFNREGCANCHVPPNYTSNKLTLARGFTPAEIPATLDVLKISVGTDPALALNTRKGTGYYKVPSLKGVWYRGHYLHDGSLASLEEMFDPGRLSEEHVPGGYSPPGRKTRAVKGHEFGLKLTAPEREQLLAFLRTL